MTKKVQVAQAGLVPGVASAAHGFEKAVNFIQWTLARGFKRTSRQ